MYINVNASVELRTFVRSYRECTKVTALHCDHEEADTRMLPHAKHASRDAQRIVIQSPDTDCLIQSIRNRFFKFNSVCFFRSLIIMILLCSQNYQNRKKFQVFTTGPWHDLVIWCGVTADKRSQLDGCIYIDIHFNP